MAIVRNLTLIKCTPGYPMSAPAAMPMSGHPYVFGGAARAAHLPVIVERKRFVGELTAARVQIQTTDLPSIVSAPPHERRP